MSETMRRALEEISEKPCWIDTEHEPPCGDCPPCIARRALAASEPSAAPGEGCTCQGCGRAYRVDLLVPDDLWAQISPKPIDGAGGGGLLCGRCIVDRLEALGYDYWHPVKPSAAPDVRERVARALHGWGDPRYAWESAPEATRRYLLEKAAFIVAALAHTGVAEPAWEPTDADLPPIFQRILREKPTHYTVQQPYGLGGAEPREEEG